eukprot:m.336093 g.336093  ORF g.336093 m.336093 type:complete len:127 (+) comp17754_c0_seq1:460-840(+)
MEATKTKMVSNKKHRDSRESIEFRISRWKQYYMQDDNDETPPTRWPSDVSSYSEDGILRYNEGEQSPSPSPRSSPTTQHKQQQQQQESRNPPSCSSNKPPAKRRVMFAPKDEVHLVFAIPTPLFRL